MMLGVCTPYVLSYIKFETGRKKVHSSIPYQNYFVFFSFVQCSEPRFSNYHNTIIY